MTLYGVLTYILHPCACPEQKPKSKKIGTSAISFPEPPLPFSTKTEAEGSGIFQIRNQKTLVSVELLRVRDGRRLEMNKNIWSAPCHENAFFSLARQYT